MEFYFTPPTVSEGPAGYNILHYRYRLDRGVTVVNEGGVYRETRYPSKEELDAATKYYVGGYKHLVNATEKASLEAAGYTVTTE